jgi:hypothetical protein
MMTTAITIDAHAGWDVDVCKEKLNLHGDWEFDSKVTIKAFTKEIIYIHSHLRLSQIVELRKE